MKISDKTVNSNLSKFKNKELPYQQIIIPDVLINPPPPTQEQWDQFHKNTLKLQCQRLPYELLIERPMDALKSVGAKVWDVAKRPYENWQMMKKPPFYHDDY
jgi:hypothetical protein